jgi:multidrug efflux pump subunit AcrA (membrane-fusion protein)
LLAAGPAVAQLPAVLEHFRKLSPEERQRLLDKAGAGDLLVHKVARRPLALNIVERGTLAAARNANVVCEVRAGTKDKIVTPTIKWLIDNGSAVKKGDKLIELDDSFLQEELKGQRVALEAATAAKLKAEAKVKFVRRTNEIDLRLREIALRLAERHLKDYKGEDRDRKEELELKVEQARLTFELARVQVPVKLEKAQAELAACAATLDSQKGRLDTLEADLRKCVLRAPRDGIVIYFVPEQARFGLKGSPDIVAEGEPVREGQIMVQIADLSQMLVSVSVHEGLVSYLRSESPKGPASWQPALIRVDAFPGRVLKGHVKMVDTLPLPLGIMSDVKMYRTLIAIDDRMDGLKPGMSAEVALLAQGTAGPVLNVPVQAVVPVGRKRYCFVQSGKAVDVREVVLGISDNRAVEVRTGLDAGDRVLLSPRALLRRLALLQGKGARPGGGKGSSRRGAPAAILVESVKPPAEDAPRRSFLVRYGLTALDWERIAALPTARQTVPVRSIQQEARHARQSQTVTVVGTSPAYELVKRLKLADGRFLRDDDGFALRNVAVLGAAAAEELFPLEDPLGEGVVLGKQLFVVIGVLDPVDQDKSGGALEVNRSVFVPLPTCNARFGERILVRRRGAVSAEAVALHSILVTVPDARDVPGTVEAIQDILELSHSQKDWAISRPEGP